MEKEIKTVEETTRKNMTKKVEKVNEYSDDGSFLFNILLLILRIIILVSMGPILFVVRCFMISKIKCTEEWETREMK